METYDSAFCQKTCFNDTLLNFELVEEVPQDSGRELSYYVLCFTFVASLYIDVCVFIGCHSDVDLIRGFLMQVSSHVLVIHQYMMIVKSFMDTNIQQELAILSTLEMRKVS